MSAGYEILYRVGERKKETVRETKEIVIDKACIYITFKGRRRESNCTACEIKYVNAYVCIIYVNAYECIIYVCT